MVRSLVEVLLWDSRCGANWHAAYSQFLVGIGMQQGATNPCHFTDLKRGLRGVVHGDDFLFTGSVQELEWLRKKFESQYACKIEVAGYGG